MQNTCLMCFMEQGGIIQIVFLTDLFYLSMSYIYNFSKLTYILTVANIKHLNFTSLALGMICI